MNVSFIYTARAIFILLSTVFAALVCYFNRAQLQGDPIFWAGAGAIISGIIVLVEALIRDVYPKTLAVGSGGLLLGLVMAALVSQIMPSPSLIGEAPHATGVVAIYLFFGYICSVFALRYVERIDLSSDRLITADEPRLRGSRFLDTSVLIDGRILEMVGTGFLDGIYVIPKFVLDELQNVADSADSSRRQRGRRGLDIVRQLKETELKMEILDKDYPHIQAVDAKLIQCAKDYQGRIVTNDFNLNKVAEIHNIPVLNVNDLANALKPVILPGETLTVPILKAGKEAGQGVGYLDDGTMVVVEEGLKFLREEVEVVVTSILQTTAGRMIFGRLLSDSDVLQAPVGPPRLKSQSRKVVDLDAGRETKR